MKILSIDTSSNICAVAVLEDTTLLKELSQNNGYTHSENLMPIIRNILKDLNLFLSDIDLIVCDKGPGSFTGIRIGVATSKAFSDSQNIPSIGISSLETLAYNISNEGYICSLIDAKKDNAYWGLYKKENNTYSLCENLSTDNIYDIINKTSKYSSEITFVGDGSVVYKNIILNKLPNSQFTENNDISAYNLGIAGFNKFSNNIKSDLLPLYLRKPQAERMMEEKLKNEK